MTGLKELKELLDRVDGYCAKGLQPPWFVIDHPGRGKFITHDKIGDQEICCLRWDDGLSKHRVELVEADAQKIAKSVSDLPLLSNIVREMVPYMEHLAASAKDYGPVTVPRMAKKFLADLPERLKRKNDV